MELINILKIKIRYLLKYDKIINKKLNKIIYNIRINIYQNGFNL
jgi:hypothetical protein